MRTTRIALAARPDGIPSHEDFTVEEMDLREPDSGQVGLQTVHLSLDPYMRGRMNEAESYARPVELGETMPGATVSRVVTSRDDRFQSGDLVLGYGGWQTHSIEPGGYLRRLNADQVPVSTALGVLGMPGYTAYAGLLELGQPQPGETVVVAAAAGPVGSAVGQIARLKGARAVGIAGGPEKVAHLKDDLGFDAALDHRSPDFTEQLADAVPNGIDVYFENVGGKVFDAVLPRMNQFGRIPVCGLAAHYNETGLPDGPDRTPMLLQQILIRRLTVRGFLQFDFPQEVHDSFLRDMTGWVADGKVQYREDVAHGLGSTIDAFVGMLAGKNFGKQIVTMAD